MTTAAQARASQNGTPPAVDDVGDQISLLLAPLQQMREQLVAKREDAHKIVSSCNAEIRRIDRLVKAADPDVAPAPKKKPAASKSGGHGLSDQLIARVEAVVTADKDWTARDVHAEMSDVGYSSVSKALVTLHSENRIRLVANRVPGRKGTCFVYRAFKHGE